MRILAALAGAYILALVVVDAFNTILLARRTEHIFRIARVYYRCTWNPFAVIARRIRSSRAREGFLSIYGPLSLVSLFGLWALALTLAFALLQWAVGIRPAAQPGTFANDLYLSLCALVTVANGDPVNRASKLIAASESLLGFGIIGMIIGYLPVLYQSFSRRELQISLLDARAGSPPSASALLRFGPASAEKLHHQLTLWEEWCAQLLENHLSFPMLAYFRSQHSNQSWLTALVAIVDCTAVISTCSYGDLQRQSDLTFAMGRHVLADLAIVFGLEKVAATKSSADRLSGSDFQELKRIVRLKPDFLDANRFTDAALHSRRELYEPQAAALSEYFMMTQPAWIADSSSRGNWRVTSSDEIPFAVSDPFSETR